MTWATGGWNRDDASQCGNLRLKPKSLTRHSLKYGPPHDLNREGIRFTYPRAVGGATDEFEVRDPQASVGGSNDFAEPLAIDFD